MDKINEKHKTPARLIKMKGCFDKSEITIGTVNTNWEKLIHTSMNKNSLHICTRIRPK